MSNVKIVDASQYPVCDTRAQCHAPPLGGAGGFGLGFDAGAAPVALGLAAAFVAVPAGAEAGRCLGFGARLDGATKPASGRASSAAMPVKVIGRSSAFDANGLGLDFGLKKNQPIPSKPRTHVPINMTIVVESDVFNSGTAAFAAPGLTVSTGFSTGAAFTGSANGTTSMRGKSVAGFPES